MKRMNRALLVSVFICILNLLLGAVAHADGSKFYLFSVPVHSITIDFRAYHTYDKEKGEQINYYHIWALNESGDPRWLLQSVPGEKVCNIGSNENIYYYAVDSKNYAVDSKITARNIITGELLWEADLSEVCPEDSSPQLDQFAFDADGVMYLRLRNQGGILITIGQDGKILKQMALESVV